MPKITKNPTQSISNEVSDLSSVSNMSQDTSNSYTPPSAPNRPRRMSTKFVLALGLALILAYTFFQLEDIKWGSFKLESDSYITVTGTSDSYKSNEVSTFTAGVTVTNEDKTVALQEINTKASAITEAVKKFGIEEKDVKTTNMNIYQQEEPYLEGGIQKYRAGTGEWRAYVSIQVTLRDVSKANELSLLLGSLETTDIYGPNFMLDSSEVDEVGLLSRALDNAKSKAETLAISSGRRLGKVIKVVEGADYGNPGPYMLEKGMGGGGGFEPGATQVSKTVTVTYSLK